MSKPLRRAICWVRRDLRLRDHAALALATAQADQVAVVFIFDRNILEALQDRDDRRVSFIYRSLEEMDHKLQAICSRLVVRIGKPEEEIPKLAKELKAEAVFTAQDCEPYAKERDAAVAALLATEGRSFETIKDTVIFEAGEVITANGDPFRVYTPYSRAWRGNFVPEQDAAYHHADKAAMWPSDQLPNSEWSFEAIGFTPSETVIAAGEDAAKKRLLDFTARLSEYREDRNFPAQEATSGLSVHLRFGTISIRECVRTALADESDGADKWLSELIWRDFYQDILAHSPHVVKEPFQAKYRDLVYPGEESHWIAWCEGQTGYPLIDAAMRCLRQTGTMHNRLRMVIASFLTKDLLIDYRRGEAWFARFLLDFDLASNNGGWQWAASTGCDPQPYFRIFNPITQSETYDPDGVFIRRWVPELRELKGPGIHFPAKARQMELTVAGVVLGETYPWPIVDHAEMRPRAIEVLKTVGSP
jgi:deoxyribodipyrimidine photo-lyase